MIKTSDFFNYESVIYTRKAILNENHKNRDALIRYLDFYLCGRFESLWHLGHAFTYWMGTKRACEVGVGWYLRAIELYDNGYRTDYSEDKAWERESDYHWYIQCKRDLALIFLPNPKPLIHVFQLYHTKNFIKKDHEFGMKMLMDVINSSAVCSEDYEYLSVVYYQGKAVKKDLMKAREYLDKAIELDRDDPEGPSLDPEFIEYYKKLLETE